MDEENKQEPKPNEGDDKQEQQPGNEEKKVKFPQLEKAEEMLKKMEEKEKSLAEREKALDNKIKEFDEVASQIKIGGFSTREPQKTEEEIAEEAAMQLIDGSGFEDMIVRPKKK